MKLVPMEARHTTFVGFSFLGGAGRTTMPADARVIVAEADEPDDEGKPVFLGWAAVSGDALVWVYVKRSRTGLQQIGLDQKMLAALGLDLKPGARVRALYDGTHIRAAAARYDWILNFVGPDV